MSNLTVNMMAEEEWDLQVMNVVQEKKHPF